MQAVNLLPVDLRGAKHASHGVNVAPERALRVGGACVGALVLIVAALYIFERAQVSSKKSDLADSRSTLVNTEAKVATIRATEAQVAGRVNVVRSITGGQMVWDHTLADLARVLPNGVFLENLQASAPTTASVAEGTPASTFTTVGVAPATVRVADVLDRLALLPWLSDVSLQSTSRQDDGTSLFTVTGIVVPASSAVGGTGS
jgi:Tfp pilus assembly protein PilN